MVKLCPTRRRATFCASTSSNRPGSTQPTSRALHVPPRRVSEVLRGRRPIDADTDLRLARYFGLSAGFFLGLQADFDLMQRRRELGDDLDAIKPRAA